LTIFVPNTTENIYTGAKDQKWSGNTRQRRWWLGMEIDVGVKKMPGFCASSVPRHSCEGELSVGGVAG
jgi:hypothetical protein